MSERLVKELDKLKYANIQKINGNEYLIRKEDGIRIIENKYYMIHVDKRLMNNDNIYATNWNKGKYPKANYYQVCVEKILGNMIRVTGVGSDDTSFKNISDNFSGWLPIEMLEVISKI